MLLPSPGANDDLTSTHYDSQKTDRQAIGVNSVDHSLEGRVVPGLLILVVAEGLYVQTGHTHHGRAYLGKRTR